MSNHSSMLLAAALVAMGVSAANAQGVAAGSAGPNERGANYYGSDCTSLSAIPGGAAGYAPGQSADHARSPAGGVIVGGASGAAMAGDSCSDRRFEVSSYRDGFEGQIDQRYSWGDRNGPTRGSFTPTREYAQDGNTCRAFTTVTHRNGQDFNGSGTACRANDGNWYLQ